MHKKKLNRFSAWSGKIKLGKLLLLAFVFQISGVSCIREDVDPNLKNIIQYGLEKAIFYRDCINEQPNFKIKSGNINVGVITCKHEVFDQTSYVIFDDLEKVNFAIQQIQGNYLFAGCVSGDDIKTVTAHPSACETVKKYKVSVNAPGDESFLKYFIRDSETIKNLKGQLGHFLEEKVKKRQHFFIAPFGEVDAEVSVYWKEKNEIISISRNHVDWNLKKLNFAAIDTFETDNSEKIEKIVKYGIDVVVP
jgi:hypothetical protein